MQAVELLDKDKQTEGSAMNGMPQRTNSVEEILKVLQGLPAELAGSPDIDELSAGAHTIKVAPGDSPDTRTVTMQFADPELADRVRRAATGATGLASAVDAVREEVEDGEGDIIGYLVTLYAFPVTPLTTG